MEYLDLYDDNGKKLNKVVERGSKLFDHENIMLAVIFIKNKNNEYLIQKTSKEKGGLFATTGGHVIHKEDSFSTIMRETKEELGILIPKEKVKLITKFKYKEKPLLFHVYETIDVENTTFTLQKEEVESVVWLSKEKIKKLIQKNQFSKTHGYIFEKYMR